MKNIVIIGASGHAKVVSDIVEEQGKYKVVGVLDKFRGVGDVAVGKLVLGDEDDLPQLANDHNLSGGIVAIGDNFRRSTVSERVRSACP